MWTSRCQLLPTRASRSGLCERTTDGLAPPSLDGPVFSVKRPIASKKGPAMVRLWAFSFPLWSVSFPVLSLFNGLRRVGAKKFSRRRLTESLLAAAGPPAPYDAVYGRPCCRALRRRRERT